MHWRALVSAEVGGQSPRKNSNSHIDASHSRQPLVKGERLVRYEVNAVMLGKGYALRERRNHAPLRDYCEVLARSPPWNDLWLRRERQASLVLVFALLAAVVG